MSRTATTETLLQPEYEARIAELRAAAAKDIAVSDQSEADFRQFLDDTEASRRASVVLTPDGNFRAVWNDPADDEQHLAVEFVGNGQVHYAISHRPPGSYTIARCYGAGTFSAVRSHIRILGIQHLLS